MESGIDPPAKHHRPNRRPRRRAAALIVYFDTSALLKSILLDEEGTALVDDLWRRATTKTANLLLYPEARAALAAAHRAGRLNDEELGAAVAGLESACRAMHLIRVDEALAWRAGALAEQHALRGYDAIHLATALAIADPQLVLATWDHDLRRAAHDAGVVVVSTQGR